MLDLGRELSPPALSGQGSRFGQRMKPELLAPCLHRPAVSLSPMNPPWVSMSTPGRVRWISRRLQPPHGAPLAAPPSHLHGPRTSDPLRRVS